MDIDLNSHGDPHWLSAKGKVNRDAIRAKHRKAHFLTRERVIKQASPETRAKLEAVVAAHKTKETEARAQLQAGLAQAKRAGNVRIVAIFHQALSILDASEATIRDMIEGDLMDVAGPNSAKRNLSKKAVDGLMKKIAVVRVKAIKDAFKHLRANLPNV